MKKAFWKISRDKPFFGGEGTLLPYVRRLTLRSRYKLVLPPWFKGGGGRGLMNPFGDFVAMGDMRSRTEEKWPLCCILFKSGNHILKKQTEKKNHCR